MLQRFRKWFQWKWEIWWVSKIKSKIRRWELDGYDCKLWKDFVSNLGYVSLVWLWDTGLTVRIRKFDLVSSASKCLPCWHLLAWSRHGETTQACEICAGLMMMATEQCQWCCSSVCIVGFGTISQPLFLFLLLALSG